MAFPRYYLLNGELKSFKNGLSQAELLSNWLSGTIELRWRASGTRIPFFQAQYKRLQSVILSFNDSPTWIPEADKLESWLVKLIQSNRLFKGVEIRFYFKPGPKPNSDPVLLILSLPHPQEQFQINDIGLIIGPADDTQKHPGKSSLMQLGYNRFKTEPWIKQAISRELDTIYFTGSENQLFETFESNIYLIKGKKVFTPAHDSLLNPWGISQAIQKACHNLGMIFSATPSLLTDHLNQADEVFLGDDYYGIRWVMGHQNKRFFRKNSPKIIDLINTDWKNSI